MVLDVRRDEIRKVNEAIAEHGRWIWWANLWLGYAKFLLGFSTAVFIFERTRTASIVTWSLLMPFWLAFLVRNWLPRVWKRMPEAK